MQTMQERHGRTDLLTAEQVEQLLDIDKSTVYRMAADGRLPALKIGRQWRFPAARIHEMLSVIDLGHSAAFAPAPNASTVVAANSATGRTDGDQNSRLPASLVQPIIDLAADLLGVMMVVTDMDGHPITEVANPCPWFVARRDDPAVLDSCIADWCTFADELGFGPRLRVGVHGFECARALIRDGSHLVGMVLAGGIAPAGHDADDLYHLDETARDALLATLPRVAAALSKVTPRHTDDSRSS